MTVDCWLRLCIISKQQLPRRILPFCPQGSARTPAPSSKEQAQWRGSRLWLAGAGVLIAAYVVLSGNYIEFSTATEDFENDDGGDNDD